MTTRLRPAVALLVVGALAACGTGASPRAHDRSGPEPTSTTGATTSTTTTTTPSPDITPAPTPVNVRDARVSWFNHPALGGTQVLLGVVGSALPGPHPAIVLAPGSDGFNTDYIRFAEELAARGFDVGFGCWWANLPDPSDTPESVRILCVDAPPFKGIVDDAVPDLDALVDGVSHVLGEPADMAVLGFSRGGGMVALRASAGRPEAVVSVAGLLEGWTNLGAVPGEVNVVERVDGIHVPVLVLHGTDDTLVPAVQAEHFEAALQARGADVEAHYYEGQGHGLSQDPWVRADIIERVRTFLCARYACGEG